MEDAVYLLCAATALACGLLLLRGYRRSRARLLLWCGLFFLALVAENGMLFIDRQLLPHVDLSALSNTVAFLGTVVLLFGLIWDSR